MINEELKERCRGKKFYILTFGCQMNEHDSEILAGLLSDIGMSATENRNEADVAIINTCSIRDNADKRFFGTIGQFKKLKKEKPDFVICACGCMMQQQRVVDTLKAKYPWVDIIFGTHNLHRLPELLAKVICEKQKITEIWQEGGEIVEGLPSKRLHKHKAYVNITYGCNNFCTYCIVPYTRGRERSRKAEDIVAEVRCLVKDGVKEVMLLGQNVNSYNDGVHDFADLLHMVNDVDGLLRIRFMTSHPKDLTDKLIDIFCECDKIAHFIHLPVQSGSSNVLKKMNRHYDRERYLERVARLKEKVPDIAISTDIIVGFPGETYEEFCETLSLCRQVEYDSAFTFMYSIRPGTPAATHPDQVPEEEKHKRFDELVEVINESALKRNLAMVGKTLDVLVDGQSEINGRKAAGMYTGRTDGFKLVNFAADDSYIGKMIKVRITGANTFSLKGEIAEQKSRTT